MSVGSFVLIWLFVAVILVFLFPLSGGGGSNMAGDGFFGGRWRREELSEAPARRARR